MASPPLPMYPSPLAPLPMTDIECPTNHDVKSGRGVSTNAHPGNERFRSLVNCNKELYVTSTKRQKMAISRSIVEAVRSLDPPGRFLEKNPETGLWNDIGDRKAIEKTSQALRDGAAALRKQLSADMNDPDFLSAVFDTSIPNPCDKKPPAKSSKKKGKPPAKGHRRVKSNPTVGTVIKMKALTKKVRSGEAPPMSPKSSVSLPAIPRPLQSPISPGPGRCSPGYERNSQDQFRRGPPERYRGSPPGYLPGRSASFDYHDLDRSKYCDQEPLHGEPLHHPGAPRSPIAYGYYSSPPSPSGFRGHDLGPPHPLQSPRGRHLPPSPRSGQVPPQPPSPRGHYYIPPVHYRRGPPSPTFTWSPREVGQSGQSMSPYPYLHSSDMQSPYRSPEYRPSISPRHRYCPDSGRISPGLSVPTLGGEHGPHVHAPPSPMWRGRGPDEYSSRSSEEQSPHPNPEFLPPPPALPQSRRSEQCPEYRYASPNGFMTSGYPNSAESHDHRSERYHESSESDGRHPGSPSRRQLTSERFEPYDKPYDRRTEPEYQPSESKIPQRDSTSDPTPPPPHNLKIEESFDSPSGIADIRADMTTPMDEDEEGFEVTLPGIIETRRSSDNEDFPFDEDDPAGCVEYDDIEMSPLPYDGHEDPTTLLELPANLLKLPISPVGPQDQPDEI